MRPDSFLANAFSNSVGCAFAQAKRIKLVDWIVSYVCVRIQAAAEANGIALNVSPNGWVEIPVVVVMYSARHASSY